MLNNNGAADTEETRRPIGSNDGAGSTAETHHQTLSKGGAGATATSHPMLSSGGDAGGAGCRPTWNRRGGSTVMAARFPPSLKSNGVGAASAEGCGLRPWLAWARQQKCPRAGSVVAG